jgi:bacteriorhodopsin
VTRRNGSRAAAPLIKSRRAVIAVVVFEVLFIGYLVTQAFSDDDMRAWYGIGAIGLTLMTAVIWWTRLRRSS